MGYAENDTKYCIVLNKKHDAPVALNAATHAMLGMQAVGDGHTILEYPNNSSEISAQISQHPIIILSAKNSNQIATLVKSANEKGIPVNYFTTAMIDESAEAQINANREADWQSLNFVCAVLFGGKDQLSPLTKRYSLYK